MAGLRGWFSIWALVTMAGAATAGDAPTPPPDKPHWNILATDKSLYSHAKEELLIRDFFHDRKGGFFLDVGCGHPIDDSNTYYLEHHLGWKGIGVDALPDMAPKWKRHRPDSEFANFIVTDHADTVDSFFRVNAEKDISSIEKRPLDPGGKPVEADEIKVPTITLTKLLEHYGVKKIDFMSMDIEGAEPLALAGFDIDRFQPELVCIEAKVQNREPIAKYMATHHYRRIESYLQYDKTNYYYTPDAAH